MSELISRRAFLADATLVTLSALSCTTPQTNTNRPTILSATPEVPVTAQGYTDNWCKQLGSELRNWKLVNGTRIVDFNKEAQLAASLLLGEIDPSIYIPKVATL